MDFSQLIAILNSFLDLGIFITTPFILFVLALIFGVPIGRATRAAITYGIGFVGIFVVLDLLLGALSNVASALVANTGLTLDILDVGWPVLAAVAFGVPTFVTVFVGVLVVNILMFILKLTKTLDIDFHNYYHWVVPATMVYFVTDNLVVGTIVGVCSAIITFKIADWTEKYVADWWELPGISIPHMSTVGWFPVAYLIDWVLDRIPGVNKIRIDSGNLQERLGVLGEPMLVGFILGLLMSIIAGLSFQDILVTSMQLAASMILMPRMIGILMEGLVPIFQSARDWVVARFPEYDFRIGLDAAVLVGKAEVLTIGILMTPVMILLAIILPGNRVLPFADLAIMTFFMIWAVGVNRGNLFRALIIGVVISSVILYGSAIMAPTITGMGEAAGFEAETEGLYVSLEAGAIYGSQLLHTIVVGVLNMGAWVIAAITVVATAILIPVFKWVTSLPKLAADVSDEQRQYLVELGYNIKT